MKKIEGFCRTFFKSRPKEHHLSDFNLTIFCGTLEDSQEIEASASNTNKSFADYYFSNL